jgi:hypothetical protein
LSAPLQPSLEGGVGLRFARKIQAFQRIGQPVNDPLPGNTSYLLNDRTQGIGMIDEVLKRSLKVVVIDRSSDGERVGEIQESRFRLQCLSDPELELERG